MSSVVIRQRFSFIAAYGLLVGLFLFVMGLMEIFPAPFGAAALILIFLIGLSLARPAFGIGTAIVLTVVGDAVAMRWWPIAKNLSARESLLYTADPLTFKPLEMILLLVLAVTFISSRLTPNAPPIVYGPLWRPLLVFSATLVTGMVWGLNRGGDFRVAVFEVTPLIYIPLVYLAITNLFTTLQHYRRLMVGIIVAIGLEALHTLYRLPTIRERIPVDASPVEHTAVLHMSLLLLSLVAAIWFGTRVDWKRLFLFFPVVPTVLIFLDAQRRAGVVALIIGGITITVVLFHRNRRKFYQLVPAILVITTLYTGAFWGVERGIGFPAQAIKTVIAPGESGDKDSRSDLYREIENYNLNATIRSNPVIGIGFGRPFLQPIPLPDISFFEFSPYIPHNSVLWVWTKLGIVGFLAFLYSIALGIVRGVRAAVRFEDPDDASMVAVFTAYLPMLLVLAYVEIAFDAATTMLFAVALALSGAAETLAGLPEPGSGDEDGGDGDGADSPDDSSPVRAPQTAGVV